MDEPRDYHSKSDREGQISDDVKWNLKYGIYETKTGSQTENRLMVAKGGYKES